MPTLSEPLFVEPRSFARFFNQEYYGGGYKKFRLDEMARKMHIYKQPIKFDEDDIRFLHQIPRRFWKQALYKRYHDDLLEALQAREEARRPIYEAKYKELYEKYLGEESQARNPDVARRCAAARASREAELHAERQVPHVDYPKTKVYEFRVPGGGEPHHIEAAPNIEHLIHRIEGESDDPAGYDLWNPRVSRSGRHSATRGMNLMKAHTASERLSDWLNYTAHRMLGELDHHPPESWGPDSGEGLGQSEVRDTFTIDKVRNELQKTHWMNIPGDPWVREKWLQMFPKEDKVTETDIRTRAKLRRKLAAALAWHDVVQMASQGQLRTPPSPSHPKGRIVNVRQLKDGSQEIVPEQLHLPKKKVTVTRVNPQTGERRQETHEVPILLPGKFLRKLTQDEMDAFDELERTGEPVPRRLGHGKDFVEVDDYPDVDPEGEEGEEGFTKAGWQGTNHIRAGAFHPNQNTPGRKYLDPCDPRFPDQVARLEKGLLRQGGRGDLDDNFTFTPNAHGQYFGEIVEAIKGALGEAVGGAESFEQRVLRSMGKKLYSLAWDMLLENLDDPTFFRHATRYYKIKTLVSNYAQQDWSRGTRRLRGERPGMDPDGEDLQSYMERIRARAVAEQKQEASTKGCDLRGARALQTGYCQFKYNLRVLHDELLADAERDAHAAEQEKDQADSTGDSRLKHEAMTEERNVIYMCFYALAMTYENMGMKPGEAEERAQSDILTIKGQVKEPKAVVERVRELVEQLSAQAGAAAPTMPTEKPLPDEVARQWQEFEDYILQDPQQAAAKLREPSLRKPVEALTKQYPALQERMRHLEERVRAMKPTAIPPRPASVATVQPALAGPTPSSPLGDAELDDLLSRGEWARIAFHGRFQRRGTPRMVKGVLRKLQQKVAAGTATGIDRAAIALLNKLPQTIDKGSTGVGGEGI